MNKKFRVWDKLSERFIYPDKGYQGHYILDLNGRFHDLGNGSGGDEYVVQQFTGLVDKNGKDIYEGDIIVFTSTVYKGEIKPILITGDVQFTDWLCAYALNIISNDRHDGEKVQLFGGQPQVYEVIGNIFENPELLQ